MRKREQRTPTTSRADLHPSVSAHDRTELCSAPTNDARKPDDQHDAESELPEQQVAGT
jgi:hypothetical protein